MAFPVDGKGATVNPSPVIPCPAAGGITPQAEGVPAFLYAWLPAHGDKPRRCHVYHAEGDPAALADWMRARGLSFRVRVDFLGMPVFPFVVLSGGALRHAKRGSCADLVGRMADRWRSRMIEAGTYLPALASICAELFA
jgi:hypothetical protein